MGNQQRDIERLAELEAKLIAALDAAKAGLDYKSSRPRAPDSEWLRYLAESQRNDDLLLAAIAAGQEYQDALRLFREKAGVDASN